MKNIKITLAALVLALFSSCEDAIDIKQPGELTPEAAFSNVEDLQKGISGVYGAMSTISEISFASIFTDEVRLGFANGGQGITDGRYGFVLTTNSSDAYAIWQSNYTLINFANRLLAGAENVKKNNPQLVKDLKTTTLNSNDEVGYRYYVAQAKALRAYGHFKLLSYFSVDMTKAGDLGVILMDHVPATNERLGRNTNKEVLDFIDKDLKEANSDFTIVSSAIDFTDKKSALVLNYVSPTFINAFQARLSLYRGQYATAQQKAQAFIDTYALSSTGTYRDIWKKDVGVGVETELIFKLDKVRGNATIGSIWNSVNATLAGSPFYSMSSDLFPLLNPNDIRFKVCIADDSEKADPTLGRTVIAKYPGSDGLALLNDEKVFRLAEMYLIKAEVQAQNSDFAGVQETLQAITTKRFLNNPPTLAVPTTQKEAFKMVLEQRRIELAYEGHRYLDLKRLGFKAGVDINRHPSDCKINGACFLSTNPALEHRFTMPIPNDEIMANPAIKGQQNPGY